MSKTDWMWCAEHPKEAALHIDSLRSQLREQAEQLNAYARQYGNVRLDCPECVKMREQLEAARELVPKWRVKSIEAGQRANRTCSEGDHVEDRTYEVCAEDLEVVLASRLPSKDEARPVIMGRPMEHEYKVWPEYFQAVEDGRKTFEWRKDDRTPRPEVGDTFVGKEWDPMTLQFTGKVFRRRISYIFCDPTFGLPYGYCVMALSGHPSSSESPRPEEK